MNTAAHIGTTARVAVCQVAPRFGDLEHNRALLRAEVVAAARHGAEVIVLPELATSGYVFHDRAEAERLAEPADGPTVTMLHRVAAEHTVTVVVGLPERASAGTLHNSAVVVDADGLRAVYRKAHLWDREADLFAPGDAAAPVVETAVGRLGVLVCYDLEFPEWVRHTALAGAELVCAPTNWPRQDTPPDERPIDVVAVQAAAAANRVFIAACDRVGTERGTSWVGGSIVAGPDGYPLAIADLSDRPQRLLAVCDLAEARDKAVGERNDRFADRRPELYR